MLEIIKVVSRLDKGFAGKWKVESYEVIESEEKDWKESKERVCKAGQFARTTEREDYYSYSYSDENGGVKVEFFNLGRTQQELTKNIIVSEIDHKNHEMVYTVVQEKEVEHEDDLGVYHETEWAIIEEARADFDKELSADVGLFDKLVKKYNAELDNELAIEGLPYVSV